MAAKASARKSSGRTGKRRPRRPYQGRIFSAPTPKRLFSAVDHGAAVRIDPQFFAPPQRGGGWGPFIESFTRINKTALTALDLSLNIVGSSEGSVLKISPGERAGAIPLRSAQTGQVSGGFVVAPRFGWTGVGRVLSDTGWQAAPEFLDFPLVPGSGREIPPWVLAGPVIARLSALIRSMRRGYWLKQDILTKPRGRILWSQYTATSLSRGKWDKIPCRFSDLGKDPLLRRHIRWALEKIYIDLIAVGGADSVSISLAAIVQRLIDLLKDVEPLMPRSEEMKRSFKSNRLASEVLYRGIEALGWVVDERGLGGGREQDGLSWYLSLNKLWENYVEAIIRKEAALYGGVVKVGRLGETVFPLSWTDATHRSLGHLVPDIVVRKGRIVSVVDAKYKAHLSELDEAGWYRFTEDTREAHRADIHQILAYAALYDAEEIKATLVYPLRRSTWESLKQRGRETSRAQLFSGSRQVTLELRGLPFGMN